MSCNKKKMLIFVWTRFSTQKSDPNERDLTKKCVCVFFYIESHVGLSWIESKNKTTGKFSESEFYDVERPESDRLAGGKSFERIICVLFFFVSAGDCVLQNSNKMWKLVALKLNKFCVIVTWFNCRSFRRFSHFSGIFFLRYKIFFILNYNASWS